MSRYNYTVDENGVRKAGHIVVWESMHGPIPKGFEIHHKDGNGHNNDPENLVLLSHKEHDRLHTELRRRGEDVIDPNDPDVIAGRAATKKWSQAHPEMVHARAVRNREAVKDDPEYRKRRCESSKRYREAHLEERRAYDRQHRIDNHEAIAARERERYAANRDKIRETQRQYELRHKEERAARNARYAEEHKEERAEYFAAYRAAHRDERIAKQKKFREEHAEEIKAKAAALRAKQREYLAAKQRLYSAKKRGAPAEEIARRQAEMDAEKLKLQQRKES